MPDLEPITREEMLLDGQDLEPITRKEMFIKRIYDKTQVVPEPITREEMFLKKAGDETTDVTIEQLNVSANGTYSESGKAYSPVIVNVPAPPIPDNAYLLNEVEGLPSDIATFTDGSNLPMPSLKVGIEPIQEGSGDPSPTNIRPISGWDEVNVSVSGVNVWDEEWEVGAYNTNNGEKANTNVQIRSKGYIEVLPNVSYYWLIPHTSVISGFAVALYYDANKNYIGYQNMSSNGDILTMPSNCSYVTFFLSALYGTTYNNDISINYPSTDTSYHAYNGQTYTIPFKDGDNPLTVYGGTLDVVSGELKVVPYYDSYNGETLEGEWMSDRDVYAVGTTPTNGAQVVNIGATPITYQLTPTQVKSLLGSNNVWADTGDIIELEYFSKEV